MPHSKGLVPILVLLEDDGLSEVDWAEVLGHGGVPYKGWWDPSSFLFLLYLIRP
jgi:hypothetical protein